MRKLISILLVLFFTQISHGAGDITYDQIDLDLDSWGVTRFYTEEGKQNLMSAYLLKLGKLEDIKDDENVDQGDKEKQIKFLSYGLEVLEQLDSPDLSTRQRDGLYVIAQRIFYSAISLDYTGRKLKLWEKLAFPFQMISRITTSIPYLEPDQIDQPIGRYQAKREARFLISKQDDQNFVSVDELARMTAREVSLLDNSNNHPHWHSRSYMADHPTPWQDLENFVIKEVERKVQKKKDVAIDYNLDKARKILFFSKVKDSATSPKINTKDIYGMKWKLKWGIEVQVEPVLNRLYTYLGAKWADLVYGNHKGERGAILVLDKKRRGL